MVKKKCKQCGQGIPLGKTYIPVVNTEDNEPIRQVFNIARNSNASAGSACAVYSSGHVEAGCTPDFSKEPFKSLSAEEQEYIKEHALTTMKYVEEQGKGTITVTSVNGQTGKVVLTGKDIPVSDTITTKINEILTPPAATTVDTEYILKVKVKTDSTVEYSWVKYSLT